MFGDGLSPRERWGLFDPKVEHPTLSDIRKRWLFIGAGAVGLALFISSFSGEHPSPVPKYPTTSTSTIHHTPVVTTPEECLQNARRDFLAGDTVTGQAELEQCKENQKQDPLGLNPVGTTAPQN